MQTELIRQAAQDCAPAMNRFLRDLIRIPGEGQQEESAVARICEEMRRLGFDRVWTDRLGNALGSVGSGDKILAFDGHVDTVGIGDRSAWSFDPYEGFEDDVWIGGRGSSDQRGGIVASVYGAKIMKELGLIPDGYQILVVGSVQEEECEGLNWQCIVQEEHIRPELVVLTEPTDGNIYRGHRGRMDIIVEVGGRSAHGSTPEKGVNAISRMSQIVGELDALNERLKTDAFLGKGTLTVTQIFYGGASRCAIPDSCTISIDRRLTAGEDGLSALDEIRSLPSVRAYHAEVRADSYARPSWKGHVHPVICYFPAWTVEESAPVCRAMEQAVRAVAGPARIDKWLFSTNGVSIMGRFGIPCIGYGPGLEGQAHAPDEKMPKADLVRCAAAYAAFPAAYQAVRAQR